MYFHDGIAAELYTNCIELYTNCIELYMNYIELYMNYIELYTNYKIQLLFYLLLIYIIDRHQRIRLQMIVMNVDHKIHNLILFLHLKRSFQL